MCGSQKTTQTIREREKGLQRYSYGLPQGASFTRTPGEWGRVGNQAGVHTVVRRVEPPRVYTYTY